MTHDDLERRRPLWDAMSDLFLDTEVRWSLPRLAKRCVESGYDAEALERIFWVEVFPEGIGNLTQVAGEWAALSIDEAALIKRANEGSVPWLKRRAFGWMVAKEWLVVRALTAWLRGDPRGDLLRALDVLGRAYFDGHVNAEEVEAVRPLLVEAWARYEPLCQSMLLDDEQATPEAVQKLLKAAE